MKKLLVILFIGFGFISCEDVIELDLNTAEPKLVVEANISVLKDDHTPYNSFIRLTESTSFYNHDIPFVDDAVVTITSENNQVFSFIHTANGYYEADFIPEENIEYTLEIIYKNEVYQATTSLKTTSSFEYVEQKDDGGFFGDQIELKAFFSDPAEEENFYYFVALCERGDRRSVSNDEFYNGNTTFLMYTDEDLIPGDEVRFHLYGTSEGFYNFMSKILQQSGTGSPFDTPPAGIRGNVVNTTNGDNFPYGYFRISEVSVLNYTVE